MNTDSILALAFLTPLAGCVLIGLLRDKPNLREAATLVTAVSLFLLVASLLPAVLHGERPKVVMAEPFPGLTLGFELEPLGMLFALVASFLWIVTSIYSIGYMRGHKHHHQTRFYMYFAIAIASAIGVAFAGNLLTLFVFYEVLTLSTFPLVTHSGTEEAKRAGRLYLGLLLGTSIGLQLLAIIGTWHIAGSLQFVPGGILRDKATPMVLGLLLVLYVFGIGKAALMPLHRWLPAAMVAPTPVSALLHAVAVVKVGVFTILKVAIYVFGIDVLRTLAWSDLLLYVATATVLIASLVAMSKDNLKARLAYSTVSQLSYVVAGAMLATTWAALGAGLHIVMHAFGKITLFFCAGAITLVTHKTNVSQMRGLGRSMPFTMTAFFIGSLCIVGLPPTGGMWSKWFLALGTLEPAHIIVLVVLMLSSLLNVGYLLMIPVRAFFAPREFCDTDSGIKEAPVPCLIALAITSLGCIALFFYPDIFYQLMASVAG